MQIFLPQILAVLFGLSLAYLNSVPVNLMIRYGVKLWQRNEFHNANFLIKLLIAFTIAGFNSGVSWMFFIDFFIVGLWMWIVFDVILNLFIDADWDYIGVTSKIDKKLHKLFPKNAGKIKFIGSLLVITGLNVLAAKM
jgi:hypothetical protein